MPTVVGISVFELHIPQSRSLKEKRRVVKSLIERIFQRYRVSNTESDFHDLHQRSEIAIALVARGQHDAERILEKIRDLIEERHDCQLTLWQPEFLDTHP